MTSVDLNADMGESFGAWTIGDDDTLLTVVKSANIACGFHGGDPMVMNHTVRAALTPAAPLLVLEVDAARGRRRPRAGDRAPGTR